MCVCLCGGVSPAERIRIFLFLFWARTEKNQLLFIITHLSFGSYIGNRWFYYCPLNLAACAMHHTFSRHQALGPAFYLLQRNKTTKTGTKISKMVYCYFYFFQIKLPACDVLHQDHWNSASQNCLLFNANISIWALNPSMTYHPSIESFMDHRWLWSWIGWNRTEQKYEIASKSETASINSTQLNCAVLNSHTAQQVTNLLNYYLYY